MGKKIIFYLALFCSVSLLKTGSIFSQIDAINKIKFDSIKCVDINFTVINHKLSLYKISYLFLTKTDDYIVINKNCNYRTTGFHFSDRRTEKIFGFQKDSIYTIIIRLDILSRKEIKKEVGTFYSYLKFKKLNSKTFNHKQENKNHSSNICFYNNIIEINNKIYDYSIDYVSTFHSPPDYLLPLHIYPYYNRTRKGNYTANKKNKDNPTFYRWITDSTSLYISTFDFLKPRKKKKQDSAKRIVGVYMLDLEITYLGIYSDSIDIYRDLTIEFKRNKTFKLNKSVPFIADTMGTWTPKGRTRWSCIYYDNDKTGNDFSFIRDGSPILYIKSVRPRTDQFRKSDVHTVYFKKIENE